MKGWWQGGEGLDLVLWFVFCPKSAFGSRVELISKIVTGPDSAEIERKLFKAIYRRDLVRSESSQAEPCETESWAATAWTPLPSLSHAFHHSASASAMFHVCFMFRFVCVLSGRSIDLRLAERRGGRWPWGQRGTAGKCCCGQWVLGGGETIACSRKHEILIMFIMPKGFVSRRSTQNCICVWEGG